jgi:hypothetical protein
VFVSRGCETPRGRGVAPTAFGWAHASWDNAEAKLLREAAWPGGCGVGDHTLAANSGPTSREESEKTPKSSCCLTKCKDNRRVVMVAVVLAHRADLPVGEKTSPCRFRTNLLPEPPQDP